MSKKYAPWGSFHFLNPFNYARNLSDYNYLGVSKVTIAGREYKTVPDVPVKVIFGLDSGVEGYNRVLAQTIKDAREHFGKNVELIASDNICARYQSVSSVIISLDGEIKSNSYLTTRDICTLANRVYFSKNKNSRGKVAFVAHPSEMERFLATASQEGLEGTPFTPAVPIWGRNGNGVIKKIHWITRELLLGRTVGSLF